MHINEGEGKKGGVGKGAEKGSVCNGSMLVFRVRIKDMDFGVGFLGWVDENNLTHLSAD